MHTGLHVRGGRAARSGRGEPDIEVAVRFMADTERHVGREVRFRPRNVCKIERIRVCDGNYSTGRWF